MKHRIPRIAFGLVLGLAARGTLPGHHPGTLGVAAALSLLGASAGEVFAELALPPEMVGRGSLVLAGIGSLTALLVQAVIAP